MTRSTSVDESLLRRAHERIREQKAEIERLSRGADEVIAIVGYACRFPGSSDADAFWELLCSNSDAFSEIKDDRWPAEVDHDPGGRVPGTTYTRTAGLIDDIDSFDARFFGISAIEAASLDPQQRLLLETSWHAFEHAGCNPEHLKGSNTGVFVGLTSDDYARLHARSPLPVSTYTGLGSAKSMAAGRLAYFYDFHGPVVQLDTTCSSSMVALHLAARELREQACDLALVAGANAIISPDTMIGFCEMKALSPTGRLMAFDNAADGYVRGEGCGAVVLKRLSSALADGDEIHAVIDASAMNHDGRTNGLTAPNRASQEAVMRAALRRAGRGPFDLDYVEAHGTGTRLGDLVELGGLAALHAGRSTALRVGSVKSSIGHLEAAAGMASIIKVILSIKHGFVPGQANFDTPNANLDWEHSGLSVNDSDWAWPDPGRCRAGVSAFGMSGTNVHVLLSSPPDIPRAADKGVDGSRLLFLSAASERAMGGMLAQTADALRTLAAARLPAFLAQSRRRHAHAAYRHAVRVEEAGAAADALMSQDVRGCRRPTRSTPRVAVCFSGQGGHWPSMGQRAYQVWPAFREALDRCAGAARPYLDQDLIALCTDPRQSALLDQARYVQPALVAMGIALWHHWHACGLRPEIVFGHSIGEIASAVAAGAMTLESAIILACCRGEATHGTVPGAMFAVAASPASIQTLVDQLEPDIAVAAWNAPNQVTLSCAAENAHRALDHVAAVGAHATRLPMPFAFHSPMMQPVAAALSAWPAPTLRAPASVTWLGTALHATDHPWSKPDYFLAQLTTGVDFRGAVDRCVKDGIDMFVEIGPDAVLAPLIRSMTRTRGITVAGSLRREQDAVDCLDTSLARLFDAGVQLAATSRAPGPNLLPGYPFDRSRHWLPLPSGRHEPSRRMAKGFHPVLCGDPSLPAWQVALDPDVQPHLLQHRLFGRVVFAGASWLALLAEVARRLCAGDRIELQDVQFLRPLLLADHGKATVVVSATPADGGYLLHCRVDEVLYCQARAQTSHAHGDAPDAVPADLSQTAGTVHAMNGFYEDFAARGYQLGNAFQWLRELRVGECHAIAQLRPPVLPVDAEAYMVFPGLLDAAFHAFFGLLKPRAALHEGSELLVPSAVGRMVFHLGAVASQSCTVTTAVTAAGLTGDLALADSETGRVTLSLQSLQFSRIPAQALGLEHPAAPRVHHQIPRLQQAVLGRDQEKRWLIVVDAADDVPDTQARWPGMDIVLLDTLDARLAADPDVGRLVLVHPARDHRDPDSDSACCARWAHLLSRIGSLPRAATYPWHLLLPTTDISCTRAVALAAVVACARHEYPALSATLFEGEWPALQALVDDGAIASADAGHLCHTGMHWQHTTWLPVDAGPSPSSAAEPLTGTAIVTGGSGGLAAPLVAWLATQGIRDVVLVSRTAPALPLGVAPEVRVGRHACDVGDAAQVDQLFAKLRAEGRTVTTIVHAAGVLADRPLGSVDSDDFMQAMRPKLVGLVNLAACWDASLLQRVVVVSSLVSVSGAPGQAAYCAANAQMDRWIEMARQQGVPAVSINLGPLDVGMAARLEPVHRRRMEHAGLALLSAAAVGSAIEMAILQAEGRLVTFAGTASRASAFPASRPVAVDREVYDGTVLGSVCAQVRELVGDPQLEVSGAMTLSGLGVDSLLAAELATWVQRHFNIAFDLQCVAGAGDVSGIARVIEARIEQRDHAPEPESIWAEGEL
ncbi:SDR family NAD(P)-dependent oxidoreductase [Xanthomonas axonopodis]